MEFMVMLFLAPIIGGIIGLIVRKKVLKKLNPEVEGFLNKRGTTLESELQKFIDSQNLNEKVLTAHMSSIYKYKNNECICIIVKFKIEGKSDWYAGIVSDSGTYTDMKKFNLMTSIQDTNVLLQKIYKQPTRKINEDCLIYLPKLENIYNFRIAADEKVIFNSQVNNVRIDNNLSIGRNAKLTMTDKRIFIYNGVGLWTIELYNDISDYKREESYLEIALSEICIFGQAGERICTGFKFFFDNTEELDKFENIMNNIIK